MDTADVNLSGTALLRAMAALARVGQPCVRARRQPRRATTGYVLNEAGPRVT
jgi:hypothetical protein